MKRKDEPDGETDSGLRVDEGGLVGVEPARELKEIVCDWDDGDLNVGEGTRKHHLVVVFFPLLLLLPLSVGL